MLIKKNEEQQMSFFKSEGEGKVIFKTGAIRNSDCPRFSLIPPEALYDLATRFTLGAGKYGDNNWQKGVPIAVIIDHMMNHILNIMTNTPDPDSGDMTGNFGAILWGASALAWYFRHKPDLFSEFQGDVNAQHNNP